MVSSSPITARKEPSAGAPPAAMSAVLGHLLVMVLCRHKQRRPHACTTSRQQVCLSDSLGQRLCKFS